MEWNDKKCGSEHFGAGSCRKLNMSAGCFFREKEIDSQT